MRTSIYGALLGLATITTAQVATFCSPDNKELCYSVNVPDASASSGSGDIFIQIKAPSSLTWAAVGQGDQMAGANIFVIHANADGNNVTLSPRLGRGEVMPQYSESTKVELLAGSGIENGMMIANFRCSSCTTWSGGSMDLASSSSSWIWAMKNGDALSSNSESAQISEHDDKGTFTLDLGTARGGSSSNPFVSQAATTDGNTTSSSTPSGNTGSSAGTSSSSGTSTSGGMAGGSSNIPTLLKTHGIIMGVAFTILFPLGVLIRALVPKLNIWAHGGVQILAYVLAWAGAGIGIYVAKKLMLLDSNHAIIGLVVLGVMVFQPLGGILQHSHAKKHGSRGIWGHGHRWLGLALVLLGIVNGGLGLQLADNTRGGMIAYGVIGGVMGLATLAGFAVSTLRKPSSSASFDRETKRTNGSHGS